MDEAVIDQDIDKDALDNFDRILSRCVVNFLKFFFNLIKY